MTGYGRFREVRSRKPLLRPLILENMGGAKHFASMKLMKELTEKEETNEGCKLQLHAPRLRV